MSYMRTVKVHISKEHALFSYADNITALANNLSNAVRFRQRQVLTAVNKESKDWTDNEKAVMSEIRDAVSKMDKHMTLPTKKKSFLSYRLLDAVLKYTDNPDYYAAGLPRQSAQHVIRQTVTDMKSFYAACKEYHKNPKAFTGKPELPGYKHKNGHCSVVITNQDCHIRQHDMKWYAEFPYIKKTPLCIGYPIPDARLKQVIITPDNGRYICCFQFEVETSVPALNSKADRICAVDFGVDNLMAVTNNCGIPSLLYKGGVAKSINQGYNKQIAVMMSEQTLRTGKKFVPDGAYYDATNKRNDQLHDLMHKCAKHFITWCVENRIDTVVLGVNKLWKQKISLGAKQDQEFVQIPFYVLRRFICYLCERNGIRCIEQEESYTSKASFLDMDDIPIYGKEPDKISFSGKRRPLEYKGNHKKDGFRGLYVSKNGMIINSDLNGSANILRKAYPNAFIDAMPDFEKVQIIRHPDIEKIQANRQIQISKNTDPSHAKTKRQHKKQNAVA